MIAKADFLISGGCQTTVKNSEMAVLCFKQVKETFNLSIYVSNIKIEKKKKKKEENQDNHLFSNGLSVTFVESRGSKGV